MFGGYYADKRKFTLFEMFNIADEIGEKCVPYLGWKHISDFDGLDSIIKGADGKSKICDVKREGIVWRTEAGDVHFKAKSRDYKISWEKLCEKDGE